MLSKVIMQNVLAFSHKKQIAQESRQCPPFSNMISNNWAHRFLIRLAKYFHSLEIIALLATCHHWEWIPRIYIFIFSKRSFPFFCDLIFIFHLGASPSDSNKWTHFQKCIQFRRSLPLLSLQISKYYNHYQIGEFPLLVFAQRYQTKSFITFESKMSLPFLSTLGRPYLSIDTIYLDTYDLFCKLYKKICTKYIRFSI